MRLEADTVRVFVSDLARAISFYRDALGIPLDVDGNDGGFAIFRPGGMSLLIEVVTDEDAEAAKLVGRFVGLSFRVDDVAVAYEELSRRGVRFDGGPETQPWGGTLAHFYDPDRNVLTLVEGRPNPK
jgi:catechol 2,3-dioxygenase-like lactoylglutathione lyase family enzyme